MLPPSLRCQVVTRRRSLCPRGLRKPLCQDRGLPVRIPISFTMRLSTFPFALAVSLLAVCRLSAQQSAPPGNEEVQEFAVTVGALSGTNPNAAAGPLALGSGVAFQANYARKFSDTKQWASLYWEVNVLANPFRHLSGLPVSATSQIRSVYVTPGVRLQFAQQERITPWVDAGAGYAFYDSSSTSIGGGTTGQTQTVVGAPAGSSGNTNTYAVDFGAGVDIVASKRYVIRGDVRGIYTGNPNFGTSVTGGQFNFIVGGGIVWKFSK